MLVFTVSLDASSYTLVYTAFCCHYCSGHLYIFWLYQNPFRIYHAQVDILKQPYHINSDCSLKGYNGGALQIHVLISQFTYNHVPTSGMITFLSVTLYCIGTFEFLAMHVL